MRGAEIEVSLPYFLNSCGLHAGSIKLLDAHRAVDRPDVFVIVLYGEDERLPETEDGLLFPKAQIVIKDNPYTYKRTGKIVINK